MPPGEDRVMATGNMHRKFGEVWMWTGRTDKQTGQPADSRHAYHNIPLNNQGGVNICWLNLPLLV